MSFKLSSFNLDDAANTSPKGWNRKQLTLVTKLSIVLLGSFGNFGPPALKKSTLPVFVPTAKMGVGEKVDGRLNAKLVILVAQMSFVCWMHLPLPRSHS